MNKTIYSSALILLLCSSVFAEVHSAKIVSGMDNLTHSIVSDCSFVVDVDGQDSSRFVVGLRSETSPINDILVSLPLNSLPLKNGFLTTDTRGNKISYQNGRLSSIRKKSGEGSANETISLELSVSPDLANISNAKVQRLEGFIFKSILSEMECQF